MLIFADQINLMFSCRYKRKNLAEKYPKIHLQLVCLLFLTQGLNSIAYLRLLR